MLPTNEFFRGALEPNKTAPPVAEGSERHPLPARRAQRPAELPFELRKNAGNF